MNEYAILESALVKKANRTALMLYVLTLPVTIVCAAIVLKITFQYAFVLSSVVLVFLWLLLNLCYWRKVKSPVSITTRIDDDQIIHQCGKKKKNFLWKNITTVKVTENKTGIPVRIRLYGNSKQIMCLYGFHEMRNIADLILERIQDGVSVRIGRWHLNWENPFLLAIFVGWPTISITACVFYLIDKKVFNIIL